MGNMLSSQSYLDNNKVTNSLPSKCFTFSSLRPQISAQEKQTTNFMQPNLMKCGSELFRPRNPWQGRAEKNTTRVLNQNPVTPRTVEVTCVNVQGVNDMRYKLPTSGKQGSHRNDKGFKGSDMGRHSTKTPYKHESIYRMRQKISRFLKWNVLRQSGNIY